MALVVTNGSMFMIFKRNLVIIKILFSKLFLAVYIKLVNVYGFKGNLGIIMILFSKLFQAVEMKLVKEIFLFCLASFKRAMV